MMLPLSLEAATVSTKHGPREGQVIVREFDEVVITIVAPEDRLFQFYADDVEAVTASAEVLIATTSVLREAPSPTASPIVELATGTEVSRSNETQQGWIKVETWGEHSGWLPEVVLTDAVDFSHINGAPASSDPPPAEAGNNSGVVNATASRNEQQDNSQEP